MYMEIIVLKHYDKRNLIMHSKISSALSAGRYGALEMESFPLLSFQNKISTAHIHMSDTESDNFQ
jgi:hypothetical protein